MKIVFKMFLLTLAITSLLIGGWAGCVQRSGYQHSGRVGNNGYLDPSVVGRWQPQQSNPHSPKRSGVDFAAIAPGEEVWIISTPSGDDRKTTQYNDAKDTGPGSGAMLALLPPTPDRRVTSDAEPQRHPMPLRHTKVNARVDSYIASVDVTQQFHNPFDTKIEAAYVFPLPQDAAVTGFVMQIGTRRIRGILREREEATRLYREARAAGHNAALLTQERPNIFTQKVANLEPGQDIDVNLTYFQTLAYEDETYSFVFPMVVGPRYNPPGFADPVKAVGRGKAVAPASPGTTVSYLRPQERSGHDIDLTLTLAPGVEIQKHRSHNHRVAVTETGQRDDSGRETLAVRLAEDDRIPNKDFVFSYKVAGDQIRTNVLTHRDPKTGQGYFTMALYPPAEIESLARQAMEMVFVVDCSGSMRGKPIAQAKRAILAALDRLEPKDTFQIIRFSSNASQLGPAPVLASRENIRNAKRYVKQLQGVGGTQMIEGIKASLDFEHDPQRFRVVTFLTDGYIGNDRQIIRAVHDKVGEARIFSFGVGSSPNRYLMYRMAKEGRGAAAYLGLNDDGAQVMDAYFDRISHPALTHLALEAKGGSVSDVYPANLPDLFVGRPVVVTGKFTGDFPALHVSGRAAQVDMAVTIGVPEASDRHPALAKIWARQRIADLSDQMLWEGDPSLARSILRTALDHELMSDYTAFVAVDAARVTEGGYGVTVPVSVPVPEGVRYDTTVTE